MLMILPLRTAGLYQAHPKARHAPGTCGWSQSRCHSEPHTGTGTCMYQRLLSLPLHCKEFNSVAGGRGAALGSRHLPFWELAPLLTQTHYPGSSQGVLPGYSAAVVPPWLHLWGKEGVTNVGQEGLPLKRRIPPSLSLQQGLAHRPGVKEASCKGLPTIGQTESQPLITPPTPTPIPIRSRNSVLETCFIMNATDYESLTQTFFEQMGKLRLREEKGFVQDDNSVRG